MSDFIGRFTPTKYTVSPALRQNVANDTPEEAVLAYIRGDVDYEAAKAAVGAIDPNREFIARMCEAIKLMKRRATEANRERADRDRVLLAEIDQDVRTEHPKADKETRARIIKDNQLLVQRGGTDLSPHSIVKKLPPSRERR